MKDEPTKSAQNLDERLARFPEMYERMQKITDQLEESIAKGMTADEAEEIAIGQINELGKAWMTDWAKAQHDRSVEQVQKEIPKAIKKCKKKLKWFTTFGWIQIDEQVLRVGRRGGELRPFCFKARLEHRGYSRAMQRALTDFGAEDSFQRAAARVKEHYRLEVPISAVRKVTYHHAARIQNMEPAKPAKAVQTLITEMDGSMIPLVNPGKNEDARKGKTVCWSEVRLCCARADGQATRLYGATLGTLQSARSSWYQTAERAGLGEKTFVHGIGDGAPWIVETFADNFGSQGEYLIDFYHVTEYLAAAAQKIAGEKKASLWLRKQKGRLLMGQVGKILRSLEPHQESDCAAEKPVRNAYRYIQHRGDHLQYPKARKAGLPIGSGEVESGHRHVIQQRMKIAGAWWREKNAQRMLGLRIARANHCWERYWACN